MASSRSTWNYVTKTVFLAVLLSGLAHVAQAQAVDSQMTAVVPKPQNADQPPAVGVPVRSAENEQSENLFIPVFLDTAKTSDNPLDQLTLEEQHEYNVFRVKIVPVLVLVIMALLLCNSCKSEGFLRRTIHKIIRIKWTRTITTHHTPLPVYHPIPQHVPTTTAMHHLTFVTQPLSSTATPSAFIMSHAQPSAMPSYTPAAVTQAQQDRKHPYAKLQKELQQMMKNELAAQPQPPQVMLTNFVRN